MKVNKISLYIALAFAAVGMQSCLDYDNPSDEFQKNDVVVNPVIIKGNADNIDYMKEYTQEEVTKINKELSTSFSQGLTGVYAMRGGKEGQYPGAHSYQYQYTLGPDNYAQYFTVPHSDFYGGTLISTYAVSKEFNGGPKGCYTIAKNAFAPLLNNAKLDTIPEMKAIYLLLFNYSSLEVSDIYGPLPYSDYKSNKETSPFAYQDLRTIYYSAKENIDTIVKCFKHYEQREAWYKKIVSKNIDKSICLNEQPRGNYDNLDMWVRFANSLKLRMAIHMAKVEPETAKAWAEEAVAGGVIEDTDNELGLYPSFFGFTHPVVQISSWGDIRLNASFVSLLKSLDHPYLQYAFTKNSDPIIKTGNDADSSAPSSTEANSDIIGMRGGTTPGIGQSVGTNPYIAMSTIATSAFGKYMPPLYLMKLSEVCFLRAEGALRGWNMGGTAQHFYEEGIRNAGLEDRTFGSNTDYAKLVDAYMNVSAPKDYTYVDPTGNTPDQPSVTTIGVKWDESLSQEKKLEMIITQKYIASFPYSYEAWVDLRRTGYPKLFPILNVEDSDGSLEEDVNADGSQGPLNIIRRMPWSSDDPQTVEDIQSTGLPALDGADLQSTRLWWDTIGENF